MSGPLPKYRPSFSSEEIHEAQKLVGKRQVPHGVVVRAQMVLLFERDPTITNPEAGRRLGVHENTVRYWRKRWATEGFQLEDSPRPGRPPKFSPRTGDSHQGGGVRAAC